MKNIYKPPPQFIHGHENQSPTAMPFYPEQPDMFRVTAFHITNLSF